MSLLQISEPGESQAKAACTGPAVGIDLGTTNSLVAAVRDGDATILEEDGEPLIPSVVHYSSEGTVIVGGRALSLQSEHPTTTISSAKRFVGRSRKDIDAVARMMPYKLADEGDGRSVFFDVGHRKLSPVQVSADILRAAKARAESSLGSEVEAAVITVPAYFDDAQRQATKDAGRLAGLQVLRLLAEPTAAALAYGLDRGAQGTYAVYDLGGGTFDISILKLVDGVFEVKATGGDSALGGDDIDRALARWLLERSGHGRQGESVEDSMIAGEATWAARRAKEALSSGDSTHIKIAGETLKVTRGDLLSAAQHLLDRTAKACRRALKDAEIRKRDLDGVILVGGSTRSPVVRDFVTNWFGREPLCDLDPEQVVALGAASQAHMLAGGGSEILLLDVIPLSLGLETMGGVVEKLISRNSTIPTRAKQTFTTYADNQTGFDLHVLQGERETADACRSLARFTLRGVPPMVAGMARVEIVYEVDADGLLKVAAKELTTGIEASIDVKPSYGLTDEEVEKMLLDSYEHAESDLEERNLLIERVEAERILAATRTAIEVDAALLDEDTAQATRSAMTHLETVMAAQDHLAIRRAVEALDHASKPFAEKRMNRAVRAAVFRKVYC